MSRTIRTLFRGAEVVVTMDDARREIRGGDVLVENGKIVAAGENLPRNGAEIINAAGCVITPGLVNTHHHLFQTLTRGSDSVAQPAEDYDFSEDAQFQQPDWPRMAFIEHQWAHDWTNWWVPNRAGVEAMLRASGFAIEAGPADEVYLCRTAPVPFAQYGPHAVYPSQGDAAP